MHSRIWEFLISEKSAQLDIFTDCTIRLYDVLLSNAIFGVNSPVRFYMIMVHMLL